MMMTVVTPTAATAGAAAGAAIAAAAYAAPQNMGTAKSSSKIPAYWQAKRTNVT